MRGNKREFQRRNYSRSAITQITLKNSLFSLVMIGLAACAYG